MVMKKRPSSGISLHRKSMCFLSSNSASAIAGFILGNNYFHEIAIQRCRTSLSGSYYFYYIAGFCYPRVSECPCAPPVVFREQRRADSGNGVCMTAVSVIVVLSVVVVALTADCSGL
jgi:hypothetical protein